MCSSAWLTKKLVYVQKVIQRNIFLCNGFQLVTLTIFDVVNKREERKVTAYYKGGARESGLNLISLKVRAFPFIWEAGSLSVSQREKKMKLRQL